MKKALMFVLMLSAATSVLSVPTFAGVAVTPTSVPEPGTMLLLAAGMGAIAVVRRFCNK